MRTIDIVFDGPPAHESGRFIEVEDDCGNSIGVGEWVARNDGYWALRLPDHRALAAENTVMRKALEKIAEMYTPNWQPGDTHETTQRLSTIARDALATAPEIFPGTHEALDRLTSVPRRLAP